MELYNDLILSGKGLYNLINDDNIYNNQGIIFRNSNQILSINSDNNNFNFNINQLSIDFNYNKQLSLNNILHISSNSNIGIGIINPQNPLEVYGTISCIDINISNSILNKDIIKNIGFSTKSIDKGILKINNGGTNVSNMNDDQLLYGNIQQSNFLIWKDNERNLGIGIENPLEKLDILGDINATYYRINGNDINNIFVKDFYVSSNDCFRNCSNKIFYNSANYMNFIKNDVINSINSRTIDWIKSINGNYIQSKVGIGISLPTSSLNIIGDINFTGDLRINGVLNKIFNGNYAELNNNPGYTWDLSNANIYNLNLATVGIGSYEPIYKLDVNGSINFKYNIKKNENIIKFFDGNYNKLLNIPILSKFALSGSYYNLTELPYLFNGKYTSLYNKPLFYPTNFNTHISNIPILFKTDWNSNVLNKPDYFLTDWITNISNKPRLFNVDWNSNILNKPDYFITDWKTAIINKPLTYIVDWNSNIYNKPNFSKFSYTGDFKDLLDKPYIFSGYYRDLLEKPNYSSMSFTGDYNDVYNLPNLFSGDYKDLLNIPSKFVSDWNSNIINKPDFQTIAFSGNFKDVKNILSINTWGGKDNNIYSCNISNVGIGITNPSFKLDITQNVNFNNGLIINSIDNFKKNNPWGVYFAEDYIEGSTILPDSSGNKRHASTSSGNITKANGFGYGALGNISYLLGGTSSIINWPSGSIPTNFTILSLTRYTGGARSRILSNDRNGGNFLHGHWGYDFNRNGYRGKGCVHYDGWKTSYSSPTIGNIDDWLCCIGKNGGTTPNNILLDGIPSGTDNNGAGGYRLCINDNPWGETSDWAFGCVIIWDYHLQDEDCFFYNNIIRNYLNSGGTIKNFFKNKSININYSSYFKNSNNFSFLYSNNFYITSNWIINSNSNIYNLNKGSIGINNINPSSSYKLDVIGNINTTSNLSLLEGFTWSSYNSGIINNTTSSLINDLVIRTQLNKKLILLNGINNGTLFINSGNIGIGSSIPISIIHLHNPLTEQEIKLSLSTSFNIYKNTNHDGIIYNFNKGLCFGTNNNQRLLLSMSRQNLLPWGIYFAGNYSNNILYDISGNERHATTTGTITKEIGNGNGALRNITYISGNINSSITWPTGSIPENFTILSLTRYTSDISKKILVAKKIGDNDEWYHGHNNGKRGVCYYQDYKTSSNGILGNSNDWVYIIGKNDGSIQSNININGVNSGTNSGGSGNLQLGINLPNNDWTISYVDTVRTRWIWNSGYEYLAQWGSGGMNDSTGYWETYRIKVKTINYVDTKSDWSLSYVVIWDRHLSDGEITSINSLINNYLTNSTEPSFTTLINIQNTKIDVENNLTSINLNSTISNQELKITLTDNSSSTLGISIFKSTYNDGCLFNNKNNHLIFGTNNTEKIRLINTGNLGIGTTNPLSILHLHNITSNQEVKLLLSTSFFISKNTNNEGIINNINKGLIFGTNNNERLLINNIENKDPWGIYFAGNYSNNILYDLSGFGRNAITTGTITSNNDSNNGANASISYISGNTSSTITWPDGSIPTNFTILSLTRYTGGTRERILQSSYGNWLHGHYASRRGVCYYNDWKTNYNSKGIQDNWLCCIGKNGGTTPNNILIDGVASGINTGGASGDLYKLSINIGSNEYSDWSLSFVIIWDRHLTDDEMIYNSSLLINYLNTGVEPLFPNTNNGNKTKINNSTFTSLNIHNNLKNQESKINLTNNYMTNGLLFYKGTTNDGILINSMNMNLIFGTGNNERLRITNTGNVGIGTTNNDYTLNVNGTIQGTFNGDGANIINIDSSKFTTGLLRITNGGINTSNLTENQILIGNGTNNLIQSANFIWDNTNNYLGINTNPQYNVDVFGSIRGTTLIGNGSNITNINIINISSGILSVSNGGTGKSTLNIKQILVGNGTNNLTQSANFIWDNTSNRLGINLSNPSYDVDVVGSIRGTTLIGNGVNLTNLNISNISDIVPINKGGFGRSTLNSNQILVGDETNAIKQYAGLSWKIGKLGIGFTNFTADFTTYTIQINGTVRCSNITCISGNNITNLNVNNFSSGICSIITGGTGKTTFTSNQILIGNGTNSIIQTANLIWDNTNNRLGINSTSPRYTLDIAGNINLSSLKLNGEMYRGIGQLVNWNLYYGSTHIYYNSGSVGIGTYIIDSTYLLNVNGYIKCLNIDSSIDCQISAQTITLNKNYDLLTSTSKILFNLDTKIENNNIYDSDILKFETKLLSDNSLNGVFFSNDNVGISTNSSKYPLTVYNPNNSYTLNYYFNELYHYRYNNDANYNYKLFNTRAKTLFVDIVYDYLYNTYTYSKFEGNGTIIFKKDITAQVLLVGAGGTSGVSGDNIGGDNRTYTRSSGGGGGGVGIGTINFKKDITYNITVGEGGGNNLINVNIGPSGLPTTIIGGDINEIAYGGGGGNNSSVSIKGSTGGDSSSQVSKGLSSSGTNANMTYYGNRGDTISGNNGCGGGGGAGSAGSGMNGGNGILSSITGETQYYGAGGYGVDSYSWTTSRYITGTSGLGYNNYGAGGQGSTIGPNNGRRGVVIIRYDFDFSYKQNTTITNISANFQNSINIRGDIVGYSDNRIKNNVNDLDSKKSLDLISKIKPKSFEFIDFIEKGIKNNYGFIAQDIKEFIPEAVGFKKDIIPNIMKKFNCYDNIIETNDDLTSKLFIKDIIEIIDKNNKRNKYEIIEISSNQIKINKTLNDNECFIYGKEVDDFHILDKDIIFTLNVSATKELRRKAKKQKRKLLKQSLIIQEQERIIKEQESRFEELDKELKYLYINNY